MTEIITIDQVDGLEQQQLGGMGVGKSHIIDEYIKQITLFDMDAIMSELGFIDYTSEQFAIGIERITQKIDEQFKNNRSMIAMGTASNLPIAINRLHAAQRKGYSTILIHVDAPERQAILQNYERIENGHRGVQKHDQHLIKKTIDGAARTVDVLKETSLVDYFVYYNNQRDII